MSTILRSSSTMSTVGKAVSHQGVAEWGRPESSGAPLDSGRPHSAYIVRRTVPGSGDRRRGERPTCLRRVGPRRARAPTYLWTIRTSFRVDHLGDAGLDV